MRSMYFILMILAVFSCQQEPNIPEELRSVPNMTVLLTDSLTKVNTASISINKPTLIFLFDPDCENCKEETAGILNKIDSFANTQIFFISLVTMERLRGFYQDHRLARYKNIIVGKDKDFTLSKLLPNQGVPVTLIYKRDGSLVRIYQGAVDASKLLQELGTT